MPDIEMVSRTLKIGEQHWRLNVDKTWSVLMFGSFGPNQIGLKHQWVGIDKDKVPTIVKDFMKGN